MTIEKPDSKDDVTYYISRHSNAETVPESADYPGLSQEGISKAIEKSQEIILRIQETPRNGIVWFAGTSFVPRTQSTLKIYAEKALEFFRDDPEVITYVWKRPNGNLGDVIDDLKRQKLELEELITSNPNRRVIVFASTPLKEFLTPELHTGIYEGHWKDELEEAYTKSDKDIDKTFRLWFESGSGTDDKSDPEKAVQSIELALSKLEEMLKEFVPDRSALVISVGHSTEMNSLITKLKAGEISGNAFDTELSGKSVEELEAIVLEQSTEGRKVTFRNKTFNSK